MVSSQRKTKYKAIYYMQLNIRSLPAKFDHLKSLLSELEGTYLKPEPLLICKKWLSDSNSNLFSIPGFKLIENRRSKGRGGGVCRYIRSSIRYSVREHLNVFNKGIFESIFIELEGQKRYTESQVAILGHLWKNMSVSLIQ